jgi:hypothetical protein
LEIKTLKNLFEEQILMIEEIFLFYWWDWGLNSWLHIWKAGAPVHFALVILEKGSCKLFLWAGLKQSS